MDQGFPKVSEDATHLTQGLGTSLIYFFFAAVMGI